MCVHIFRWTGSGTYVKEIFCAPCFGLLGVWQRCLLVSTDHLYCSSLCFKRSWSNFVNMTKRRSVKFQDLRNLFNALNAAVVWQHHGEPQTTCVCVFSREKARMLKVADVHNPTPKPRNTQYNLAYCWCQCVLTFSCCTFWNFTLRVALVTLRCS